MTKVSWKRILQRAGNDLPSSGRPYAERPHLQAVPRSGPRPMQMDDGAGLVAGELESELRRALQRQQASSNHEPQHGGGGGGWDPIFVAQDLRHQEPVSPVPASHYLQAQQPRRSNTARNIIAVSLSAVVVGFAVQQLGSQWSDSDQGGGGGGGGNGGGGQYRNVEQASLGTAIKGKDQSQFVQTGYAIQPLVQPGSPTDLSPVEEAPRTKNLVPQPMQDTSDEAASMFKRDMEEARKLFDNKDQPVAAAPARAPEPVAQPAPTPAPAQIAAVTPSRIAPPAAQKAAPVPAPTTPAGPPVSGAEEGKLMQRASELMQRGDITGARLLFEHLARRGSAIGAFALAQSFDAKYLQKMYVRGLTPDQKQADYWYKRAVELGGTTAAMDSGRRQ